jgi:PAS domain S-box-containing protein
MTGMAGALLWSIHGLVKGEREVQETGQVIAVSFETLKTIVDMETGVRGYLNTGDPHFLQPYQEGTANIQAALNRIETLTRLQGIGEGRLATIQALLAEWQTFARDAIHKRSAGSDNLQILDNTRGKQLMDSIRAEFAELVSIEEQRRSLAIASSRNADRLTSRLGILLSLGAALILASFLGYELVSLSRNYEDALADAEKLSHELGEREAHFRLLAEAIPQMVWTADPGGTPEYFNQGWFDYVGVSRLTRKPWVDSVHPSDQASAAAAWNTSLASGRPLSLELRLRNTGGTYRWHLGRALALRDQDGTIIRWLGTFTDIDDQKRAEEALSRLAAIVETSEDAIYGKDLDGKITSWNRGAEKMYGYSAQEMIGEDVLKLSPSDRQEEVKRILAQIRRGESIEHLETVRVRKDGRPVEVSVSISPIRNSAGVITGASTIARDVTERNRAAEALRKTEKLAATGRLAGTMAHEINNPLEAITHLLYLIEKNPSLDAEAREYTRVASGEVARIGHIAKQALSFHREAATPVEINISDLVRMVVELYSAGAQNKGVEIETQLETAATVPAFPGEMRQVFSNLIVNAVDVLGRGGIVKVRVKHGRDWKSNVLGIRVLVSDNGPGIPEAIRPRIFEPFFTTKGEKGTGVGLWVSEGVLQRHGGRIRVKSSTRTMHGTTFAVFLPYA